MHPMTRRAATAAALLLLPGLVRADAPTGQYEAYLSTQITISDAKTHLQWTRAVPAGQQSLSQIVCSTRLPSVRELATLLDNEPATVYDDEGLPQRIYIDTNAFPGTPRGNFWTSTATPEGKVFVVNFGTGEISLVDPAVTKAHVRCVVNY